jgi:tetratricopeptide (TPR) repeat protein
MLRQPITTIALLALSLLPVVAQDDVVAKAEGLHKEGKFQEAADLLSEQWDALQKNAKGLALLARCQLDLGDNDRAMQVIVKACALETTKAEYQKLAAQIFWARAEEAKAGPGATQGKIDSYYEEALNFVVAALKLDPKDLESATLAGELAWNLNRPSDSATYFEAAAAIEPSESNHLFFAARGHRGAKNFGKALENLDKALKLRADAGWLWREKGHVIMESGGALAADQALPCYQSALTAKEVDLQTIQEVGNAIWALRGATGDPAGAQKIMEAWSKAHPGEARAKWWIGYYLAQQKQWKEAIVSFTAALDAWNGAYPEAALEAGNCARELGDLAAAAEWWGKAQKSLGANSNSGSNAVLIAVGPLFEANKFQDAITVLEHYAKFAPPNFSVYNNLGFALRELGSMKNRESKQAARDLWMRSKDWYEKASEEVLATPTADATTKAQTLNDTGLMFHYHLDDVASGVKYYRRALEQDPNFGDALENLAICCNILGKFDEAVPLLEKVLKAQPGRPVALRELGKAKKGLEKK